MPAEQELLIEQQGHVLTLQLNRPTRKNALTRSLCSQLLAALAAAEREPTVRVIVLTGGQSAFCSGNDVAEFAAPPMPGDDPGLLFVRALAQCTKPVVAAVNGPAIGVGLALLLHCDVVVIGESARLHAPFVTLGIGPQFGLSALLPRAVGQALAIDVLLCAQPLPPARALAAGLVNAVVPDAETLAAARSRAVQIAAQAPGATRATKRLIKRWSVDQALAAIDAEAEEFVAARTRPETLEAVMAFIQKRPADYSKFG